MARIPLDGRHILSSEGRYRELAKLSKVGSFSKSVIVAACFLAPAVAHADSFTLTGTVRDFNAYNTTSKGVIGHVDFQHTCCETDKGIVQTMLGAMASPSTTRLTQPDHLQCRFVLPVVSR